MERPACTVPSCSAGQLPLDCGSRRIVLERSRFTLGIAIAHGAGLRHARARGRSPRPGRPDRGVRVPRSRPGAQRVPAGAAAARRAGAAPRRVVGRAPRRRTGRRSAHLGGALRRGAAGRRRPRGAATRSPRSRCDAAAGAAAPPPGHRPARRGARCWRGASPSTGCTRACRATSSTWRARPTRGPRCERLPELRTARPGRLRAALRERRPTCAPRSSTRIRASPTRRPTRDASRRSAATARRTCGVDDAGLCFRASVSALTADAAQVSGVYTPPARRRGGARAARALGAVRAAARAQPRGVPVRERLQRARASALRAARVRNARRVGVRASSIPDSSASAGGRRRARGAA